LCRVPGSGRYRTCSCARFLQICRFQTRSSGDVLVDWGISNITALQRSCRLAKFTLVPLQIVDWQFPNTFLCSSPLASSQGRSSIGHQSRCTPFESTVSRGSRCNIYPSMTSLLYLKRHSTNWRCSQKM